MLAGSVWRDVRYGWRGFRKQPGFTLLAMLTLALGIGSATTIFSVIDNVLLDPFPYADVQRIVAIHVHDLARSEPGGRDYFPVPEFLDYREQNQVFDQVIGADVRDVLYTTTEGTERFSETDVTSNTFQVLGVAALAGRTITPDDGRPGAAPVFVISYKMW